MSDYGARASADLIVTRGKGFVKEKNKKKRSAISFAVVESSADISLSFCRGSYRGGDITMESHSIKFT